MLPSQEMGINIRLLDTCCLISTCKIAAKSLQNRCKISCGQKTQTHGSRSVYGLTIARSLPCNPLRYSPYSPLKRGNDWSGMPYGLEATAGVYHELRR